MALRQLAGPFDIRAENGTILPTYHMSVTGWEWYPEVGLVTEIGFVTSDLYILTLDGIYQRINASPLGPVGAAIGWWYGGSRMLSSSGGVDQVLEPKTLSKKIVTVEPTWEHPWAIYRYVVMHDKRVYSSEYTIKSIVGDVVTVESGNLGLGSSHSVWAGRHNQEVFVRDAGEFVTNARCLFFDLRTKTASPIMHTGMKCYGMTFSPEFGVIVTLHKEDTVWQLRVWSLEVEPIQLTTPTLVAGEIKAGHVATFRTQALGAHNDPCANELIDWTLTGVGELITTQSETDENGYATIKVRYGLNDTGESNVTAHLLC